MKDLRYTDLTVTSHPSRGRGLKWSRYAAGVWLPRVAPLAGTWIEMLAVFFIPKKEDVAPLVGEQIELELIIKNNIPAVINE